MKIKITSDRDEVVEVADKGRFGDVICSSVIYSKIQNLKMDLFFSRN